MRYKTDWDNKAVVSEKIIWRGHVGILLTPTIKTVDQEPQPENIGKTL